MTGVVTWAAVAQVRFDRARADRGAYVPASVAARLLGVHSRTVRNWIRKGTVGGRQLGRCWFVFRPALRALIEEAEKETGREPHATPGP